MGWTIGLPSLKLNNVGAKSKHCGSFAAVAGEALEERSGHDVDIDHSRTGDNIYEGYRTAEELIEYSRKHVEELSKKQIEAGGRKIRGDAVVMCATIIKPPAAMMAELSPEERIRFFEDAKSKFADIVGAENIKSSVLHRDEQGDHLHVFWEPMTPDGRLCAKEQHSLKFLGRLNKDMPEHLRACGWDINACNAYDQAQEQLKTEQEKSERRQRNGRSSAVFKAQAEREKNIILEEVDKLKDKQEAVEARLEAFKEPVARLNDVEEIKDTAKPKKRLFGENEVILRQNQFNQLTAQASHAASADLEIEKLKEQNANLRGEKKRLENRVLEVARERDLLRNENVKLRKFKEQAQQFFKNFNLVEVFEKFIQQISKPFRDRRERNDDERSL